MQNAPLQAYASALVFSPRESQIRKENLDHYLTWFKHGPEVEAWWGPVLQTLQGSSFSVIAVTCSFDGKYLASLSENYKILLWDTLTGTLRSTLFEGTNLCDPNSTLLKFLPDHLLKFSRNGQLACVTSAREVRVWEPVTGITCRKLVHDDNRKIRAIAFASNGTLAISYEGTPPQTWIYKVSAASTETKLETGFEAHSLSFLSDGTLALVCSIWANSTFLENGGELVLYNPETRVERSIPVDAFVHASFSSNDLLALLPRSRDKVVRVYDLTTGSCLNLKWGGYEISTLSFSINNTGLFVGCYDGSVHYLDLESGTETFNWAGFRGIQSIASSPGGRLAIASTDQRIRVLEVGSDSRSAKGDLAIALTNTERERPRSELQIPLPSGGIENSRDQIDLIVFSRDGKQLACATHSNIYVLEPVSGRELCLLQNDSVVSVTISGDYLASGDVKGTVRVWDLAFGILRKELEFHPAFVDAVAFSPDNRTLVSVDFSTCVRFWDVKTWGLLQDIIGIGLKRSSSGISSAAFSQNGKRIAFLTRTSLQIWDAEQYTCLQDFQVRLPANETHKNQILAFMEESYIDTTFGRIQLAESPSFEEGRWKIDDNWLFRDGRKMLWLPLDFRPTCIARYGDLFVLGHNSGKVTFFEGNTNDSMHGLAYGTSSPESRNKGKKKAPEYVHGKAKGARKHKAQHKAATPLALYIPVAPLAPVETLQAVDGIISKIHTDS